MKTNIFVPETIKVGFQKRNGTYTGKLAYVIYYDEKGKLRKEVSWDGWRDKEIEAIEFKNEPLDGFVLNKKAGGYSSGWNHRQTYVRVYDPRDFEFEIDVPNLLYILENTSSIKGKGLEGKFVYGWDGKELVLMPIDSPDYKEISEYNKVLHSNKKILVKDLNIGAVYSTKDLEEWIYMGRFDYYATDYNTVDSVAAWKDVNKGKHHFFVQESKTWNNEDYLSVKALKSISGRFIDIVSEECVDNYAELMDKLERTRSYSPLDEGKDKFIPYTLEEFKQKFYDARSQVPFYLGDNSKKVIHFNKFKDTSEGFYERGSDFYYREPKLKFDSIEEIYDIYKPHYLNRYLANGKLYLEGKKHD